MQDLISPLLLVLMRTFFLGWGRDNRALPSRDMGKWAGQENSSWELKQWPAVPQEEQLWGLGIWMSLRSFFPILTTFACFFCFSHYLWVFPWDLVFNVPLNRHSGFEGQLLLLPWAARSTSASLGLLNCNRWILTVRHLTWICED